MTNLKSRISTYRDLMSVGVLILLLILILVGFARSETSSEEISKPGNVEVLYAPQANGYPTKVYLPMVISLTNRPENIFGVETSFQAQGERTEIIETGTHLLHGFIVPWEEVEPTEGARNWSALATLKQNMEPAGRNDFSSVVLIRQTPSWAQQVSGKPCSPIRADKLDEFAAFMSDLVNRYNKWPYYVRYWELWNEPDIDPDDPGLLSPYESRGCWGDDSDTSGFGGSEYTEMLKVVYPAIKAEDPNAKVIVGGLLLDCNPNLYSGCEPSLFLKGILDNGGGNYFDGVGFHSYDYYNNLRGRYGSAGWNSYWDATGPVVIAKADYLRSLLDDPAYGLSGKFLINLKSAVLCDTSLGHDCGNNFEITKAYYIAQVYAASIAQELKGNIWYSVPGWTSKHTALLDENFNPYPAFHTYKFAVSFIGSSTYVREITEYTGVRGYVFDRGDRDVWVLWSKDGANHVVSLPGTPRTTYRIGTDGKPISLVASSSVTVTIAPVFIDWN